MVLIAASIPTLRPLMGGWKRPGDRLRDNPTMTPTSDCVSPIDDRLLKESPHYSASSPISRQRSPESQKQLHFSAAAGMDCNGALDHIFVGTGVPASVSAGHDCR
jgi:hypothetical protein